MPSAKYKDGDVIYAKWPGSDLYYKALVTNFNPVENQYRVKFINAESEADENIFDIPTKYCLSENYILPKSPSRRKSTSPSRQRRRSKSPARSPSRKKDDSFSDQSPKREKKVSVPRSRSPTRSVLRSKIIESSKIATVQVEKVDNDEVYSDISNKINAVNPTITVPDLKAANSSNLFGLAESNGRDTRSTKKTQHTFKEDKLSLQSNFTDEMIVTRRITRSLSSQQAEEVDFPKQIKATETCLESKTLLNSVQCFLKSFVSLAGCLFLLFFPIALLFLLSLSCKEQARCGLANILSLKLEKIIVNTFINWKSITYVFGWFLLQALFLSLPIGKLAFGPPVSQGKNRVIYRLNGLWALMACSSLFFSLFLWGKWPSKLITINYLATISSTFLFSLFMGFLIFCHTFFGVKSQPSGGIIKDFMFGQVVSPSFLGRYDLKAFIFKAGLISWAIIDFWYFAKQWESKRLSNTSLLMVLTMQLVYVLDAMIFEESFYYSASLSQEKCGLLDSVLFFVIYPFFNSTQLRYLSLFPISLSWYCYIPIVVVFAFGYYIYRISNLQKFHFYKDPQSAKISGINCVSTGAAEDLLADGWWGSMRYPNYLGDFLVCIAFSAPCGFNHFLPWVWPTCLLFIFIYSAIKEDAKGLAKYGSAWKQYCEQVKYRIFPYIW